MCEGVSLGVCKCVMREGRKESFRQCKQQCKGPEARTCWAVGKQQGCGNWIGVLGGWSYHVGLWGTARTLAATVSDTGRAAAMGTTLQGSPRPLC